MPAPSISLASVLHISPERDNGCFEALSASSAPLAMTREPDILVHVSAPATKPNDDLYRALADLYGEFEPHEPREETALDDSYGSFPSGLTSRDPPSSGNTQPVGGSEPIDHLSVTGDGSWRDWPPPSNSLSSPFVTPFAADCDKSNSQDDGSPRSISFGGLPFEVFPPAPAITMDSPGILPSQITEFLAMLKLQNPGRFRPRRKLRALQRDERGHWAVRCDTWPYDAQHHFWSSLCNIVRDGCLGWGVTLHRPIESGDGLGQVRLYCWGEIAEHTWLCLWLCSKGKIAGSGAKWVDAEDFVAIELH